MSKARDNPYGNDFYNGLLLEVPASAGTIVPLVMDLLHPRSVVDVGCGNGAWLAAFRDAGVRDYLGVDGDYTPRERLFISRDHFLSADLTVPLDLGRRFDLAVSLEVAEHLPETAATDFIETLTRLAPAVLFSAAVPSQGGAGHVNEQWQEYWRARFAANGFIATDPIRPMIWGRPGIANYYQQNIVVYVDRERIGDFPRLHALPVEHSVNLVHHTLLERQLDTDPTISEIVRVLPRAIKNSAKFHARRLISKLRFHRK